MADEVKQDEAERFSFEQRREGGEKLLAALKAEGIAAELIAEKGRTENYDSVRVKISDKKGIPAAELTVNGKGYINLGYIYTDGAQSVTRAACDIATDLQGGEVKSSQWTKTKAAPGGSSFLGKLN